MTGETGGQWQGYTHSLHVVSQTKPKKTQGCNGRWRYFKVKGLNTRDHVIFKFFSSLALALKQVKQDYHYQKC